MRLLRVILVLAAGVSALAGYLQERRRLKVMSALPPREARDYYETVHARDERVLLAFTILLVVGAVAAIAVTLARHDVVAR
ncbi:MAG TPA: hypothetical protein VHJ20_21000 [Polyangia bacterium]|nr:hypothetical protein [Polyangia bacterium]